MEDILSIIESWINLTPGAFNTEYEGDWAMAHDFFHAWLGMGVTKRDEERVTAFTLSLQGYSFEEISKMADKFGYLSPDRDLAIYVGMAKDLPEKHICKQLAKQFPMEI
jgi:hypothetical protein